MTLLYLLVSVVQLFSIAVAQESLVTFTSGYNTSLIADKSSAAQIYVDLGDWYGVQRAAADLAADFGRVTGRNGTVNTLATLNNDIAIVKSSTLPILVGTLGISPLIDSLVSSGSIDATAIQDQWESYVVQMVSNVSGYGDALIIAGADKRGSIFGIYEISRQIGVSPWYWWADVGTTQQSSIYATGATVVQGSPSVQYRGIFLNDEQPALTNWVQTRWPDLPDGSAAFGHQFYATVFELLLRLRANYFWPASWGSMFYVDDPTNGKLADDYGVVAGTSHTEPLARATNEQANPEFMAGPWSWATNKANVTEFLREGVERAKFYETLWTMGMRGKGDVSSPTLNASSLEDIVNTEQELLKEVLNNTDLVGVPQMWCLYKEVGGYYASGMTVPDDITLLWSDDNWGNAQRLPLANETQRSGGSGIYYHFDYVGDPRDYKWINTISLQKSWSELTQAYTIGAQRIWILNVGDLKPLEIPISHALDMAYDITAYQSPDSTANWITQWAGETFGSEVASDAASVIANYSVLTARRKYELVDPSTYSLINYNEADTVLQQWSDLSAAAQKVYNSLNASLQPAFFETVLHPALAGYTVYQIYIGAAKNNLYTEQGRTSANTMASRVLASFSQDHQLTQRYHSLLDAKWNHMLDQTHLGYQYWQQPYRDTVPPLGYVQQLEKSLGGDLGVTAEANNGTVPGDDQYHALSSNVLTLPPMDPYGPTTRWIDLFSRGNSPVTYNITSDHAAVSISEPVGTLSLDANSTDRRVYVSVDWSMVNSSMQIATLSITANANLTDTGFINASRHEYGSTSAPSVMLPLNRTTVPTNFSGFVESDQTLSFQADHFTSISNDSQSAYLQEVPNHNRILGSSSVRLITPQEPATPFQANENSVPYLSYSFYTFTNQSMANLTAYFSPQLNWNPTRPLRWAVGLDDGSNITTVQPVPTTTLGTLPALWDGMVADFSLQSNATLNLTQVGPHILKVWLLEPGLVLGKLVLDLGGVRSSYLGPPESTRV